MRSHEQPFRLILASASPRRRELLMQAGYTFEIEAADIDESPRRDERPADYVVRLAREKAEAVFAQHRGAPLVDAPLLVLGADTTVVCDEQILAKPGDGADATRMLRLLSGRTHQVLTGLAVVSGRGTSSAVETTDVSFLAIPEPELRAYVASSEPFDKAGGYGIQGYAARWIPAIHGDYFNVMGLPIARTVALLRDSLVQQTGG